MRLTQSVRPGILLFSRLRPVRDRRRGAVCAWTQFRGPTGQGHSVERDLPLQWSESSHVAWKRAVPGRGGVLIDVAVLKGVPMLGDTYAITPQTDCGALRLR